MWRTNLGQEEAFEVREVRRRSKDTGLGEMQFPEES